MANDLQLFDFNGKDIRVIEIDGGYVMGEKKVETEDDIMELSLRAMNMLRRKLEEKSRQQTQLRAGSGAC